MIKRIAGCIGIYERLKDSKDIIGLKTFVEVPTEQLMVDQLPACVMGYGEDSIIKRSSRSSTPSRKGGANIRSLEVILEFIGKAPTDVMDLYMEAKKAIFVDIHPAVIDDQVVPSVYIEEERTEGPVGYGLPKVKAFIFVIKLVYPDET